MALLASSTSGIFSSCGSLWMGGDTFEVPLELFAVNRRRLAKRLSRIVDGRPFVLLQGGSELPFYDTDLTYHVFRQESFFMWTFGVIESGCYGAVDVISGSAYLFIPRISDKYQIVWMGVRTLEDFSGRYNIRNVHYCDEMEKVLHNAHPSVLLTLKGVNSDSGLPVNEAKFPGIEKFSVDNTILYEEIADLRVFKTDLEISVLKYVTEISSEGHRKVMRYVKGGNKFEYQCESEFLHHCYSVGGCRQVAYTSICASARNTAILQYGHADSPNDKMIESDDLCLFDMGASYFGFCSSVGCCFPASGKFTADQKLIYEAVLAASCAVFKACKPGVKWVDIHILGNQVLLGELVKAKLLKGDPEAMTSVGLGAIFQPHGIGHFLGLDVHDVGGYLSSQPPRRGEPRGIDKLRTARVLQERMVLCIEPACYFIDVLLDEALKDAVLSKFLIPEAIARFRGFGGVRIVDVIAITKNGAVNFTKVPRTVKDIEKWMAGKDDKKYK